MQLRPQSRIELTACTERDLFTKVAGVQKIKNFLFFTSPLTNSLLLEGTGLQRVRETDLLNENETQFYGRRDLQAQERTSAFGYKSQIVCLYPSARVCVCVCVGYLCLGRGSALIGDRKPSVPLHKHTHTFTWPVLCNGGHHYSNWRVERFAGQAVFLSFRLSVALPSSATLDVARSCYSSKSAGVSYGLICL